MSLEASAAEHLQNVFWQACEHLLMYHTNPWELDEALVAVGYAVGPCEAQDHIGLVDVLERDPVRGVPILPRMVAEGRMGKIGGVGYYRYPGGGGAVIDPLIEDLILEEAWFAKVTRSEITDAFIVSHLDEVLQAAVTQLIKQGVAPSEMQKTVVNALHYPAGRIVL